MWWSGPRWLKSPQSDWPQQKLRVQDESIPEKKIVVHTTIVKDDPLIDISRFSSLNKLLRVTAYVLRFLGKLGGRSRQRGPLVAAEISEAEEFWVKQVQLQDGLLRVKGRLEQSELTQEEKHPILLPRSKYTDLLILHEHNRGFSSKPARQQTGQLPKDRVVACPPFTTADTDFTGAVTVNTTLDALQKSVHNLANPPSYNSIKIGDIVLVEGASKSKLLWEMGVIPELIMGREGFVRACIVKMSKEFSCRDQPTPPRNDSDSPSRNSSLASKFYNSTAKINTLLVFTAPKTDSEHFLKNALPLNDKARSRSYSPVSGTGNDNFPQSLPLGPKDQGSSRLKDPNNKDLGDSLATQGGCSAKLTI
ncbi:hypothetical protein HNY73_003384 [Argiope bruennichi]|uniref:DUF5641 domain-containing protein n=1 Tax=Argiope bruennichi TaxID=94029 RepID=A0A8T0FKZ1_ARGBR|nr:hypothetical protein HNY73_003384 [Argiope bruennichi]